MDYEKKYEKLVDAVKVLRDNNPSDEGIQNWINDNVPELKESEDGKIKEWILDELHLLYHQAAGDKERENILLRAIAWLEKQCESSDKIHYWTEEEIEPIISDYLRGAEHYGGMIGRLRCLKPKSLEKQGEQKFIWHNEDEEPQIGSLILLIMQSGTPIVAKIIEPNHTFNHGERWAYIDDLLEKQGEQNPTVEPRFKGGDWISNGRYAKLIVGINSDWLHYVFNDGTSERIKDIDKKYHLWTIQDANDGDVLVTNSNIIFIFKYLDEGGTIAFRASCTKNSGVYFPKLKERLCDQDVHPATKEQCDLFFQKMKEAGYEWDAEKKEPKKIEQKLNNNQFTPKQADILDKHIDNFLGQKSVWSEEDEEMWIDAIKYLELFDAQGIHGDIAVSCIEWLKSLKERLQPQWKPSEEQLNALNTLNLHGDISYVGQQKQLIELYEQLKKL